jgi:glycine betaine/choline ABC-type transport system substrate-binding protein
VAKKMNRKLKIALLTGGIVVALALIGVVILAILTRQAVSNYRGAATEQINAVTNGETPGVPIELKGVLLGEVLNGDYKRVKSLDSDYKELLTNIRDYVTVRDTYDVLVKQYNAGIKGEKPLGGDLLKSVNRYKAAFENRFPEEKDQAKAIGDLSIKITSTTDFDAISTDINTLLQSGDEFLAKFREKLNVRITEFQKKIN